MLVSKAYDAGILYVQQLDDKKKYLIGDYDVRVLTLHMEIHKMEYIAPDEERQLVIPQPGKVTVLVPEKGMLGIFEMVDGKLKRVIEYPGADEVQVLNLQPGEYAAVFRPAADQKADLTKTEYFNVESGRTVSVKFF